MKKSQIKTEFWWAIHNLIAHPVSQFAWWTSLFGTIKLVAKFGDWIHDWTVPTHEHGTGRG